jgi:hypothetical protein
MPDYDLRSAFPLNDKQLAAHHQKWICRLAEVSDLRPDNDRLSWYLVFEPAPPGSTPVRKLEVVTTATHLLQAGFGDDLTDRISEWLLGDEQDGRAEWLDY